ncbi:MAG: SagB/ThcOx family dehydrogenase [Candidatus Caenarcaniphilales bacterium]|nr:SagB/ThcOx family dehydrogenase [Candidatus Caenarcaniphilales bacterium]
MSSKHSSFAHFYHEKTKYSPEGLSKQSHQLDWDNQPVPFKDYPKLKTLDLSSYVPLGTNPFSDLEIKKTSDWDEKDKALAELSRLLYFANGVTAIVPYPPNPLLMRAAPSAGALYPNELYLISKDSSNHVPAGLYNFQVKTHSLVQITEGEKSWKDLQKACFDHPTLEKSSICLILSGVFYRSAWRYFDRAYRRILLDGGHILGNISLISYVYGKKAFMLGGFNDKLLNDLLQFDEDEHALVVIPLVPLDDANTISLLDHPLALPSPVQAKTPQIPEGKLIDALHEFSNIDAKPDESTLSIISATLKDYLNQAQDTRFDCFLQGKTLDSEIINWDKCSLMKAIMQRRSTRKYDPDMPLRVSDLAQILQFAYNPSDYINSIFDLNPSYLVSEHIKSYLLVNNIEGLEPGCYLYLPEQKLLKQIRFKELRQEAYKLCLRQELGRDAAALLFHVANLDKTTKIYGERSYRYLHSDAGSIGQRVNLAATKLGLGASGIGGFFDDMTNEALGISMEDIVLYVTTIGVPDEGID